MKVSILFIAGRCSTSFLGKIVPLRMYSCVEMASNRKVIIPLPSSELLTSYCFALCKKPQSEKELERQQRKALRERLWTEHVCQLLVGKSSSLSP